MTIFGHSDNVLNNNKAIEDVFCVSVASSPECLDEAMETRTKVLYCFYKIFLKDNPTNEGNK